MVTLILPAGRTLPIANSNLVVGSQFISGHSHPVRSMTGAAINHKWSGRSLSRLPLLVECFRSVLCSPAGSWWQLITLHLGKVGRYIGIWINHHYVLLGWHCSWLLKGILAWCSYRSNCILSIDFVLIKLHILVNEEEGVTSPPFKELLLDFTETPFHLWEPLGSKTLGTKTKEIDKKQWPVPSFHSYPCQRMRCYYQLSRLVYSTGSSYIVDGKLNRPTCSSKAKGAFPFSNSKIY